MTVAAPYATRRTQCKHHWWLERPQGEKAKAVCSDCSATRTFVTYKYADYNNEPLQRRDEGA